MDQRDRSQVRATLVAMRAVCDEVLLSWGERHARPGQFIHRSFRDFTLKIKAALATVIERLDDEEDRNADG